MNEDFLTELMVNSIQISLLIGLPLLGAGMIVGLIISIFQATTSIQEQTLTFVPKIIVIIIVLIIFGPWIMSSIVDYTVQLFELIPDMALPSP